MGNPIKFNEIEIKSFRGIKNYKLETQGKSIVFCGANGTGKSSFVNALEFLFTGKVNNLTGVRGINHNNSILHIGDNKKDLLVKAKINKHNIERSLTGGFKYDEPLEELVKDFENGSFLLNRQKLLNFINSQPKKRWEEAANLINFNEYDATEKVFEDTYKSFKNQLNDKRKSLEDITSLINHYCEIDEFYLKINSILKENNIEEINENSNLDDFLKEYTIENSELKNIEGINISLINEKYQNQLDVFDSIALHELKSTNNLLYILTKSEKYISSENSEVCPVCNQPINTNDVLAFLDEKQNEIIKNNMQLKNWQNENERLITQIRDLNNRLASFNLDDLLNDLDCLTNLETTPSQMDRDILINLEYELNELKIKSEDLNTAFDLIILFNDYKKINCEIESLENQYNVAKTTFELFSQKKKEAIENKFEEIVGLISEYYNFIHEEDDLSNPTIKVKNSKGLMLELIFGNEGSDPRSYASEGHLDSLGLCIFLAFAKLYNKYNLLVLDDIISTVDLDHKEMVIELLFEKFSDYTLVITTHNKLWYEQLQRLSDSNGIRNNFIFMEILGCDKIEGPIMSKNPSSAKRIEEYLKANDTFAAGNAIRRHLEFVLGDLCKIYGIPLPIKKHYTVDNYYKPVKKYFLKEIFKDTNVEEYYEDVFKKLEDTTYMGNLLSHVNEINYDLTIGEIEKFKTAVYNLEKAFKCNTHPKQFFKIDKKRKIGICQNEKCQDIFEYTSV